LTPKCENCSQARKKKLYILENPISNALAKDAEEEVRNEHQRNVDDDEQTACVMLASMSPELQRQHENMDAHIIIIHKELFDEASSIERYENSKELFHCKMTKGSLVNTHVLKIIGCIEKLGQLGFVMDHELSVGLVLQ